MCNWGCSIISCLSLLLVVSATGADAGRLSDFGRPATAAELSAWDIDVRPDFKGLPDGRGSVLQGEGLWLAKCASCHGDFGESNEIFSPIASGHVTAEDINVGRVAALLDAGYARTTLMRLSTVSTLWDYIYRAMPWMTPKSLTVNEVYALVAYVLYLGDIVDEAFVLDQNTIRVAQHRLPNRNGMTRDHGLWEVDGIPDVVGVDCSQNCAAPIHVRSWLPDHAMGDHGDLSEQMRAYGPFPAHRRVDTTTAEESSQ